MGETLDRRQLLTGIGAVGVVATLGGAASALAAQPSHDIGGTWLVDVRPIDGGVTPSFRALWSFVAAGLGSVAGGVIISSDQRQVVVLCEVVTRSVGWSR